MSAAEHAAELVARAKRGQGRKAIRDVVEYLERLNPPSVADVALAGVRARLMYAVTTAPTLPALRSACVELASDLEDVADAAPDTERAPPGYPHPWEGDAAPPTPRDSPLGQEFGT